MHDLCCEVIRAIRVLFRAGVYRGIVVRLWRCTLLAGLWGLVRVFSFLLPISVRRTRVIAFFEWGCIVSGTAVVVVDVRGG